MGRILEGKVAVVTGSGRGIGKEIVLLMAAEGAKVVVNDLGAAPDGTGAQESVAEQVAREIRAQGGQAVSNMDSVADPEGADRIIQTAVDSFGKIDILVNNAGILRDRILWNMSNEEWDAVIKVHLYGHFYCTRAAVRRMRDDLRDGKQTNGRIINFTSHSGIRGNAGQPNYSAAKMGVVGFTYTVALSTDRLGITCNAIAPRAITRLTDSIPDDRLRQLAKARGYAGWDLPNIEDVKRAFIGGAPSCIAPLVIWLAGDDAQHVNGKVFTISEGSVSLFSDMVEAKTAYKDEAFSVADIDKAMQRIVPKPAIVE